MVFKKNTKSEKFWGTILFLLLFGSYIVIVIFESEITVKQVFLQRWLDIVFGLIIYAGMLYKFNIDKNKRYIIQDNIIRFEGFGETKEIDISNIETIVNCSIVKSTGMRYKYCLYTKEDKAIDIRYDMYNEDGENLYDVLRDKYNIKTLANIVSV